MLQSVRGDFLEIKGSQLLRELIRVLVRNLGILEKDDASGCGVTISQCHAMVEVGRAGEISLNELAEILTLDKSTMSRTINNLVEEKLVVRETHQEDRRFVTIKLSAEGEKIFQGTETAMFNYYKQVFESIPEDKRAVVLEGLQLLVEAVNDVN